MKRLVLLPAAAGLALYAGWAGFETTRLPHTGASTMLLCAAILAGAAIALLGLQLWAYVFGQVFWVATALGYIALAAAVGREALTQTSGGDWAGVRGFAIGAMALVALGVGGISAMLGATLWAAWRGVAPASSALAWIVSTAVALAALGLVAWLVGYEYWYRQLARQNECLSGKAIVCYSLANDLDRFQKPERQAFVRRGCEAGDDSSCRALIGFLDASLAPSSPELRAIDARCQAGQPDTCQRLGGFLLSHGRREAGLHYLEQTCTLDVRFCASAAEAAQEGAEAVLSLQLMERGCERDDARSCRALGQQLLRQKGDASEIARLERKTCLIGDVNDCMPMMRRDLRGVCPRICSGTTENLWHTCGYCAREAIAAGERGLAEQWLASSCSSGYRWGCRDLAELRQAGGPAQVSR